MAPILPFGGLLLWRTTHSAAAWWVAPLVVFGVIPAIDLWLGVDRQNPPEEAGRRLQQARYYRWITYGIAINIAHELGHKREKAERWLAKIALAPTGYDHFYVEHNRGHHVRVATPEDPASARLGESFWAFWPRTVRDSLRSAWRLETNRFRIRSRSPWTARNGVLNAWTMPIRCAATRPCAASTPHRSCRPATRP